MVVHFRFMVLNENWCVLWYNGEEFYIDSFITYILYIAQIESTIFTPKQLFILGILLCHILLTYSGLTGYQRNLFTKASDAGRVSKTWCIT